MSNCNSYPCHLYMLFLNEKGELFPCPRAPQNNIIGYVYEPDIYQRIINYSPNDCKCSICNIRSANSIEKKNSVVNINIEIGGECNGACVYCFQKTLSTFRKHFPFFAQLKLMLGEFSSLKTATIFGGEVTIQPETLDLISFVKHKFGTKVTIVTNGFISKNQYSSLCNIIENFQVSLYGFSNMSVRLITKMDFNVIRSFCEYVSERQHPLDLKFVLSPVVVHELLPFLEWSLSLNVNHVMIYYAILPTEDYEKTGRRDVSSFANLVSDYWNPIFERLSIEVKAFFVNNQTLIQEKGINYIINHDVLSLLKISSSFLDELRIPQEKSISISCKAWAAILKK